MKIAKYDTDLTDAQWAYLQPMLPKRAKRGRPPKDRRRVIDALLYLAKCGSPWRYLPADFPRWKTVYHVFRHWIAQHHWEVIHDTLRVLVRRNHGKRSRPTAAILDSQTVKSANHGGGVGYDAGKRIKGRKRHLLVDTLGLILGVAVTPANTTERDGAQLLLSRVLGWFAWLRLLWVDGAYSGAAFAQWVRGLRPKLAVEVVKRSDLAKGFKILPRRWIVERTFGWLMLYRRLVRDYETTEASAEAWDIYRNDPNPTPQTCLNPRSYRFFRHALTCEEELVASDAELAHHPDQYFRCADPLCKLLYQMSQKENGRFASEFFPFFRKMSVFAFPQNNEFLPQWLLLAFATGQAYGDPFPKLADDLFESDRPQAQLASDVLASLRRRLDGTRINWVKLAKALNDCIGNISAGKKASVVECLQRATWAGLSASTTARNDILQMDFLEGVQNSIHSSKLPLHFTAAINGPSVSHGRRALDLMLHPLLDVACEKYLPTPLEGRVILTYLNQELHRFGSRGEQECPASNRDLLKWVAGATTYALELAEANSDLLSDVFDETGQPQLRTALKILQNVSARIGAKSAPLILKSILEWHEDMFGWREPDYYGQALDRIVHCVDMAIWLAWAPELSDFPEVNSKRGMAI